jgi:endonuclease YncB( thermonuclease family)
MKLHRLSALLTLLILLLSAQFSFAQSTAPITISDFDISEDIELSIANRFKERRVVGKIVGVHDGDTITLLDENKTQYKVRFNGIDAPELKQDFGNKAKESLSDLVFGKTVTLVYSKLDKYGRIVGNIYLDGKDINLEQIKAGFAWHYKKYQDEQTETDRKSYSEAEIKAKESKLGLWAMANPIPPSDWRSAKKAQQAIDRENRKYLVGEKGGCYYLNSSGKKSYVDKKFCANISTKKEGTEPPTEVQSEGEIFPVKPTEKKDSSGRTYIKGSRGGCYYLNSSGKKVYVDRELCN